MTCSIAARSAFASSSWLATRAVQARLAILVTAGAAVYAGWLWLFSKDTLLEAISMARGKPCYRAGEGPAQVANAA